MRRGQCDGRGLFLAVELDQHEALDGRQRQDCEQGGQSKRHYGHLAPEGQLHVLMTPRGASAAFTASMNSSYEIAGMQGTAARPRDGCGRPEGHVVLPGLPTLAGELLPHSLRRVADGFHCHAKLFLGAVQALGPAAALMLSCSCSSEIGLRSWPVLRGSSAMAGGFRVGRLFSCMLDTIEMTSRYDSPCGQWQSQPPRA